MNVLWINGGQTTASLAEAVLKKTNVELYDEVKNLKDHPVVIVKTKTEFNELVDRLETYLKDDTGMKRMEEAREYIALLFEGYNQRKKEKR